MWTRAELKDNAKKYLAFNYWKMVLVGMVLVFITGGGSSAGSSTVQNTTQTKYSRYWSHEELVAIFAGAMVVFLIFALMFCLVQIFLFHPLEIGARRFFVVSHYQKAELGELGYGFSHSYTNIVKTMFLRQLYIFLWTLLFIVPGIIKGYEYRMIPYILAENPEISSAEAFARSKQMMDGNKWAAFVLDLSFLGWAILSAFTCGILAVFYVNPYIFMTNAELYVALKEITFGGRGSGNYGASGFQGSQAYNYDPNGWNDQSSQWNQNSWNAQNNQGYQNGWNDRND